MGTESDAARGGLPQTAAYTELWGPEEGHLAVFGRGSGRSWDERIFRRDVA